MNKKYFIYEESPYNPDKYIIRLIHENLPLGIVNGSCNVICARIMGFTYANYLRYCRDVVGGEIVGKNEKYPIVYFKKNKSLTSFVELLNKRTKEILSRNN